MIYDSTVPQYHGEAFYAQVLCQELDAPTPIDQAIELLQVRLGEPYLTPADVQGSAEHRLYKATVKNAWIKDPTRDVREVVSLG